MFWEVLFKAVGVHINFSGGPQARENALVEAAAKMFPNLELECEGKRAICVGGELL